MYGAAAKSWPLLGSSRRISVLRFSPEGREGFGMAVSRMRRRAVNIWRLLLSAVQVAAT